MPDVAASLAAWQREAEEARRRQTAAAPAAGAGAGAGAAAPARAAGEDAAGETPDQLRERGNAAFKTGDFAKAEELYSRSLSKRETVEALTNRALARIKLGQAREAEADCSRVLLLDPANVKAFARRATARSMRGMHHQALEDFREAERLEPGNIPLRKERERAQAVVDALAAAGPRAEPRRGAVLDPAQAAGALPALPAALAAATPASAPAKGAGPLPRLRVEEVSAGPSPAFGRPASLAAPTGTGATTELPAPKRAATSAPRPSRSLRGLEENAALQAALKAVEAGERALPEAPPTSGYAFERAWRDVRDRPDLSRRLLVETMTPEAVQACFAKSLEPETFCEILRALDGAAAASEGELERRRGLLRALVELPSFALTRCFLAGEAAELARRVLAAHGVETSL